MTRHVSRRHFVGAVKNHAPVFWVNEEGGWLLISGSQVRSLRDPPFKTPINRLHFAKTRWITTSSTGAIYCAVFCGNGHKSPAVVRREFVGAPNNLTRMEMAEPARAQAIHAEARWPLRQGGSP